MPITIHACPEGMAEKKFPNIVYGICAAGRIEYELTDFMLGCDIEVRGATTISSVDWAVTAKSCAIFVDLDHFASLGNIVSQLVRLRRSYQIPVVMVSAHFRKDDYTLSRRSIADVSLLAPLTKLRAHTALEEAVSRSKALEDWYHELASLT